MTQLSLHEASDAHWAWMIAGDASVRQDGLRLPQAGADAPEVLALLRGIAAGHRQAGRCGMWLIVQDREVVGSCGYMACDAQDCAEIGYGISEGHRRRGLATEAVRLLVEISRNTGLSVLTAGTAISNRASQRVLSRNGFEHCGTGMDDDEGETMRWRLALCQT